MRNRPDIQGSRRSRNATFLGDHSDAERITRAVRRRNLFLRWRYRSVGKAEGAVAREQRDEHAAFFDIGGRLLDIYQGKGLRVNYNFTGAEQRRLRGALQVHNHPGTDASFSVADLYLACSLELREIRVITPQYRFIMRPGRQRWNLDFFNSVLKVALRDVEKDIQSGTVPGLEQMETLADYDHIVWAEVCYRLEMVYSREER